MDKQKLLAQLKTLCSGKKTYTALAAMLIYLAGARFKLWALDPEMAGGLAVLALAALRAGIGKPGGKTPKGTVLLLALGLSLVAVGCAGTRPLAPGADPVVVNAEATLKTAFNAIDRFLAFETGHHAQLAAVAPEVCSAADALALDAPDALLEAWDLIDVYKAGKTAVARSDLEAGLAIVADLVNRAERNLAKAKGTQ